MSFQQKLWISLGSFTAGYYTHKYMSEKRREDLGEPKDWFNKTEQVSHAIRQHPERVPKAANDAIKTLLNEDSPKDGRQSLK